MFWDSFLFLAWLLQLAQLDAESCAISGGSRYPPLLGTCHIIAMVRMEL